jgi:AraC-like DNA-binding protein
MYDHGRLFVRVSAALRDHPGASLRELAGALRVHPHTLAQLIRARTGLTFSAWRNRHRTASACLLLRTRPELSIKEVAASAGFSSTSVFDRFLRRVCGRSPTECRRSSAALPSPAADRGASPNRSRTGCARAGGSNVNDLDLRQTVDGERCDGSGGTLESSTASS